MTTINVHITALDRANKATPMVCTNLEVRTVRSRWEYTRDVDGTTVYLTRAPLTHAYGQLSVPSPSTDMFLGYQRKRTRTQKLHTEMNPGSGSKQRPWSSEVRPWPPIPSCHLLLKSRTRTMEATRIDLLFFFFIQHGQTNHFCPSMATCWLCGQ